MKLLSDILYKAGIEEVIGSTNVAVAGVYFDSRNVTQDGLFVAVRGTQTDGHKFIDQAVEQGALVIACEEIPDKKDDKITYVRVKSSSAALGQMAANYYDNPSSKLKLVGITGTNGKTTIATLLYRLFKQMGNKVGLISTVINRIDNTEIEATHTTPDPMQINRMLSEMVQENCGYCFMEVSSHAIAQNRISGLEFHGGAFTNITHEHLDFHKSFDKYIGVKKLFFDSLSSGAFALSNKDDKQGKVMLQNTGARKKYFALHSAADYKCKIVENQFSGLLLNINGDEVWAKLMGGFNAANLLVVYAIADLLDQDKLNVLTTLSNLEPVEGRFDCVKTDKGVTGVIDYAHTPDALDNILSTINEMRTGNETLITVVGCGGDRDREKRPMMTKIACEKSNKVILTSDNPRSEEPESIIKDMMKGLDSSNSNKVLSITDRREAIRTACALAVKHDIIVVAGKGHEKYQEIKGEKHPFDDKQVLIESCNMISSN